MPGLLGVLPPQVPCNPIRIVDPRLNSPHPTHTAFVWGSSSGFCQKMGDQAGTSLPLEAGAWLLESTLSAGQGVRLLTCPCCNTRTNDQVTLNSKGTLQM